MEKAKENDHMSSVPTDAGIVIRALTDSTYSVSDEFIAWLAEDDDNKRLYQRLMLYRNDILRQQVQSPDVEQAWQEFAREKLGAGHSPATFRPIRGRAQAAIKVLLAAAAVALIVLMLLPPQSQPRHTPGNMAGNAEDASPIERIVAQVIGHAPFGKEQIDETNIQDYIAEYIEQQQERQASGDAASTTTTVTVDAGHTKHYLLADGTEIWVNVGSEITYPASFGDGPRIIELKGEAYFKVSHDSDRPFVVITPYFNAIDLGTGFNVKAYDSSHASVTLCEGAVALSQVDAPQLTRLAPGQKATLDGNAFSVAPADIQYATAWLEGQFSYDGATVGEILDDLARYYGRDIIVDDKSMLGIKVKFWASKDDSFSDAIHELLESTGMDMRMTGSNNKVYISKRK